MTAPDAVREQYETLPYPPRDPAHELRRLHAPLLAQLKLARTVLWGGGAPARPMRALDAGCGTGDSAIFMAEQLRATGGSVVAIDLSETSLGVAQARAAKRGLTNIEFVRGRLETLPSLGFERFDYIVSAGVLHHLPNPDEGLAALREVLAPGGGMGLMVYAQYGRTAIYQLQELFGYLAPPALGTPERLRIVKQTLRGLSEQHWAKLGGSSFSGEVKLHGDAGLFDLFLHAQDRAYTVPELYEWVEGAGLQLLRFDNPVLYQPEVNLPGVDVTGLDARTQQAVGELLNGRIKKHAFLVMHSGEAPAANPAWDDESAVPAWLQHDPSMLMEQVERRRELTLLYDDTEYACALDGFRRHFLRLADGQRTLGEIIDALGPKFPGVGREKLLEGWRLLYQALAVFNIFGLLRPAA